MERARLAVRHTLDSVKAFLAQEAPPKLSEADTKDNFIEPIIAALGWTGIGVVTREYYVKNSQEFIDYVLAGQGGPLLAIESKSVQADLTDKAAAQLIQYCSVEGIEWAALTNGRELQFFNTFLKPDLAAKRVLSMDLLAFNNDDEFDALFRQVWQLSRESMTTPTGVRTWLNQRRLDTAVRAVLLNPESPTIRQLRKLVTDADVRATSQDLVQWFRTHLAAPVATLPHPYQRQAAPPIGAGDFSTPIRGKSDAVNAATKSDDGAQLTEVDYFHGSFKRLIPLFHALRDAVRTRVPSATWRTLKHYMAAEVEGQTFLAIKRRADALVVGLSLPADAVHPRLTSTAGEFNWSRITKVTRIGTLTDVDESLLSLVATASEYATTSTRGSRFYGVTLRQLVEAGLVEAEAKLVLTGSGREVAIATLSKDGKIVWNGRHFDSPSDKQFARLLGRQSVNGWTAWSVETPAGRQTLAEVRASFGAADAEQGASLL